MNKAFPKNKNKLGKYERGVGIRAVQTTVLEVRLGAFQRDKGKMKVDEAMTQDEKPIRTLGCFEARHLWDEHAKDQKENIGLIYKIRG